MTEPPPLDGASLLDALGRAGVKYIVVGGLAVVAHGYERATNDIDIVPEPTVQNFERLMTALGKLDYAVHGTEDFEPGELAHPDIDALAAGGNWVLITRFGRLDIMQWMEPEMDYARLEPNAFWDEVFGHRVQFCGYDDLLTMKQAAGRPQDLADIERLQRLRGA